MGRWPSLYILQKNDPDTRADAIGRCETIHHWAADTDIAKAVSPEKLNAE